MSIQPTDIAPTGTSHHRRARWLHAFVDQYHRAAVRMDRTLTFAASAFFLLGVGATAAGVLGRAFPQAFTNVTWSIEVTTLSIVTAVLLIVPQGLRKNTHMAVTYLPARLGPRGFQVLTAVNQILVVAFFFVVVRYGLDVMELNRSQRTAVLGISLYWPYLIVVVTGALMLMESLVRLLEALLGRAQRPDDGEVVPASEPVSAPLSRSPDDEEVVNG